MGNDYKQICMDIFGTADVDELKKIAQQAKNNNRNAGRKRMFDDGDIRKIQKMLAAGVSINDIAKHYGTSRQIVSKYINQPPPEGYTLRLEYMYHQTPCTVIDVNFLEREIQIQNRTDDILRRAFGVNETPSWEDFEYFLRDRCVPQTRGNIKDILKELEITDYDPLQIIEKTQGRMAEDHMWIRCNYYGRRMMQA